MYPLFLGARFHSADFEQLIQGMLCKLVHFQVRAYKKNPMKQRRRVVFGFREISKYVQVGKVLMLILANDTEITCLHENRWLELRNKCKAPVIVALDRRAMGSLLGRHTEASICAIISADGVYEDFHKAIEFSQKLEMLFEQSLISEHFWHVCCYGHEKYLGKFREIVGLNRDFVFEGLTPLFAAIKGLGSAEMIQKLIADFNCDYSLRDFGLNTSLHLACEKGDLDIVKVVGRYIFKEQAHTRNIFNDTALIIAVKSKKESIIEFMIKHFEWSAEEKREALLIACKLANDESLKALLKNDWPVPQKALVEAAKHGSLACVQLLVQYHRNEIEEAMEWATRISCEPMVNYLNSIK